MLGLALLQTIFTSASQGVAATAAGFGRTAASRELLLSGFAHAYAVGGLFCAAVSASAFMAVVSPRKAAVLRVETSGVPALVRRLRFPSAPFVSAPRIKSDKAKAGSVHILFPVRANALDTRRSGMVLEICDK